MLSNVRDPIMTPCEDWIDESEVEDEISPDGPQEAVNSSGFGCLPVAKIDIDIDIDPTDGASYLAMIQREANSLPFTKTVPFPSSHTGAFDVAKPQAEQVKTSQTRPSRPPALPKESWSVGFDAHFLSYRKNLRERLPELQKAAKIEGQRRDRAFPSSSRSETEWMAYINGVKRKRTHKSLKNAASGPSSTPNIPPPVQPDWDDEEAMMNDASPVVQVTVSSTNVVENKQEQAEEEDTVRSDVNFTFEPLLPKHIPQDPELPVLASCDQESIYVALKSLNSHIFDKARALDRPVNFLETQPGSSSAISQQPDHLPLTQHHARWLFSLILFLEDYIPPSEMADIRNIAKTCLLIVKWQVLSGKIGPDGQGVTKEQEEMRNSCWIIHRAIAIGWAQKDLPIDAENFLAKLYRT